MVLIFMKTSLHLNKAYYNIVIPTWQQYLTCVSLTIYLVDSKLVHRVFAFLERYGSINFGVYKQLKPIPKSKLQCFVIKQKMSI